jgi:hypothetical protein
MNAKTKAILERIRSLERDLERAREYLESDKHARWVGFEPLFKSKLKDGKELPPHKDWVRNVFVRQREKALAQAEKLLERLE